MSVRGHKREGVGVQAGERGSRWNVQGSRNGAGNQTRGKRGRRKQISWARLCKRSWQGQGHPGERLCERWQVKNARGGHALRAATREGIRERVWGVQAGEKGGRWGKQRRHTRAKDIRARDGK